jgi:glycosyltransferase involved in cell wall biosynthesis
LEPVKVSIIIPFYNRFDYLNQLIESIPDLSKIQIVLVDDHSSNEFIVRRKFTNASIIVCKNDLNFRFAGSARNKGIQISEGEYLFFADSDDILLPEGFAKAIDELCIKNPDVLYGYCLSFKDSKLLSKRHKKYNYLLELVRKGESSSILVRYNSPCCKFIRKQFLIDNEIKFENQKVSNDVIFSATLIIENPKIQISNEYIYSIRDSSSSLTKENSNENIQMRLQTLNRFNHYLRDYNLSNLMSPALPYLLKLARNSPKESFKNLWTIILNGQPVIFTYWTFKTVIKRYFYNLL